MTDDVSLRRVMAAIAASDTLAVGELLHAEPGLARAALRVGATRAASADNFLGQIGHHVYAGDTALHVAAAAHDPEAARLLIEGGADVSASNRRGATPLHYAADGAPGSARWHPERQAETIALLLAAGADPNAVDRSGVTPLHRAIRTRSAAAVDALLTGGADASRSNGRGSTTLALATRQTGASGSGSAAAKAQQAEIIRLLTALV